MSSNNFTFPPPPPPPPPPRPSTSDHSHLNAQQHGWRDTRGRGRGFGRNNDRGRGQISSGQRHYHGFGSSRGNNHSYGYNQSSFSTPNHNGRHQYNNSTRGGQKRRHDQAFAANNRVIDQPAVPTSVPSFNFDVNSVISARGSLSSPARTSSGRKHAPKRNVFGLAPSVDDRSSEKDEDEELAFAQGQSSTIQVTYRGQTTPLNTPEELAAWIAERKKRYPTKARTDAATEKGKADAERKPQRIASKKDKQPHHVEADRQEGEKRSKIRTSAASKADRAKADAIRLEKELAKAKKRIAELEKMQADQHGQDEITEDSDLDILDQSSSDDAASDMISSILVASDDETSSSGSSFATESDDDQAPVEISSKEPAERDLVQAQPKKMPCREFARGGRCPRGRRCHFKHDVKARNAAINRNIQPSGQGAIVRKSLYKRLQDQQEEMSDKLVVEHIMFLGDNGYLDEPSS